MPRLLCFAGMVTDLIVEATLPILPGAPQDGRQMRFEAGAAANIMIAAARLGIDVQAVGALGTDPAGMFLLEVLRDEGVDTHLIEVSATTTSPLTLALIDHSSKQHVFIGNVGQGDPLRVTPPLEDAIRRAHALYWQGYVLHETQIVPAIERVLTAAREQHIPIYFDVGPTIKTIPRERIRTALRQSTILKMTADEIPLAAEGRQDQEAAQFLLDLGAEAVIVTRGSDGASLFRQEGRIDAAGLAVNVVDTVGAGDSFNAGFLYGLLRGFSMADCLRMGNAAGAAAVQKAGAGRSVPTCPEIKTVLKQAGVQLELPC